MTARQVMAKWIADLERDGVADLHVAEYIPPHFTFRPQGDTGVPSEPKDPQPVGAEGASR